jgi:hypothetical protein
MRPDKPAAVYIAAIVALLVYHVNDTYVNFDISNGNIRTQFTPPGNHHEQDGTLHPQSRQHGTWPVVGQKEDQISESQGVQMPNDIFF